METAAHANLVCAFQQKEQAQQAIEELHQAGFRDEQIGVAVRDDVGRETQRGQTDVNQGTHAGEGSIAGAITGAGVGSLWAIGIAAGLLPAIGPVVAGGLLGSLVASAAGGAAVGGLIGALAGLGIPDQEIRYFDGEFRAGRAIVVVKPEGRHEQAQAILRRHGAYDTAYPSPADARQIAMS